MSSKDPPRTKAAFARMIRQRLGLTHDQLKKLFAETARACEGWDKKTLRALEEATAPDTEVVSGINKPGLRLQEVLDTYRSHGHKVLIDQDRLDSYAGELPAAPRRCAPQELMDAAWQAVNVTDPADANDLPVLVYVIHDGEAWPEECSALGDDTGKPPERGRADRKSNRDLTLDYVKCRDWGASLLAHALCQALGLRRFYRVGVARSVLDFGRLPFANEHEPKRHIHTGAIRPTASRCLDRTVHRNLFRVYDSISRGLEDAIHETVATGQNNAKDWTKVDLLDRGIICLGIHTYDVAGERKIQRPQVSLIHRSESVQQDGCLPPLVFDPLFPSRLAEFTCDRTLAHRIGLTFERNGIPTADNYPYCLPDGSVEVRTQVWFYLKHLESQYKAHSLNATTPEGDDLWLAIQNANSRTLETLEKTAVLRRFAESRPRAENDEGDEAYLKLCRERDAHVEELHKAYELIWNWRHSEKGREITEAYRESRTRPSSLAVEFRKNAIVREAAPQPDEDDDRTESMEFHPAGLDIRLEQGKTPGWKVAGEISPKLPECAHHAFLLADALKQYLSQDRQTKPENAEDASVDAD